MSSSSNKGPKKPPPPPAITPGGSDSNPDGNPFDSDFDQTRSVPSITKLLKRKSFKKQEDEENATQTSDGPSTPTGLAPPPSAPTHPDAPGALDPPEKLPGTKFIEVHPIPQEPLPQSPEIAVNTANPEYFVERMPGHATDSGSEKPTAPTGSSAEKESSATSATAKPAKRNRTGKTAELAIWNWAQLQTNADPLALTLAWLKNQGIYGGLFLAMRIENKLPFFVATACIDPKERLRVWKGIRWDPRIAPDLWNIFVRGGSVEATPPGTDTYIGSARNLLRNAFGVAGEDILTLVRVGPLNQCRGVLALVSKKSLIPLMPDVLRRLKSIS